MRLDRASTAHQLNDKHNKCYDEQDVDEVTYRRTRKPESERPQN